MPPLSKAAAGADDRLREAKFARASLRKIFPDHWSFLLGELALYSFVILILTGVVLTLFFKPSMSEVVYQGTYARLDGVHMSEAYASALHISFDERGGLLMRQIHHWAAIVFVAAICTHVLRIFFSGAFRRPRELNWVIGTTLFALATAEGFAGYSLPDDLLSGTGLRTAEGIMLSIPVVGTYIQFFAFGGQFPGQDIIPRLYVVHVLLIPGLLLALVTAHLMVLWHQEHTQWPGGKRREGNVVGVPLYPVFMVKTGALFFFTFGVLALLGAVAQINPIWLYGPYRACTRPGVGSGMTCLGVDTISSPGGRASRAARWAGGTGRARSPYPPSGRASKMPDGMPSASRRASRSCNAQIRARLNHFYTRYQAETPSADGQQGRYEAPTAQQEQQEDHARARAREES
jgi:quinol-cytochrome oxidoreductase complex cytochrome b subunit